MDFRAVDAFDEKMAASSAHPSTPLSPPAIGSSSDDTPTVLLRQLQEKRKQRVKNHQSRIDDEASCVPYHATETNEQVPLLSVLNVVIDHVMMPPTPMEPEEFRMGTQSNKKSDDDDDDPDNESSSSAQVLVPVLRVFGPVIRNSASNTIMEPLQSACLYIHGAFPYLLARPVVAGPDGSLHHASHLATQFTPPDGHVDWDDPESVRRIVDDLQSNLEAAIQSSLDFSSKNNTNENDNNNATTDCPKKPPRVIRRITVVVGRGFYTYCPGPPAPFLRVEYYDPRLRWKVKLMLERGLDVPLSHHPDPQQYQATLDTRHQHPDYKSNLGMDALRFHCYEAHIPYTMQFFKDWNLAGMSYIKVADGRFRHPMPKTVRYRSSGSGGVASPDSALFLESNVSCNLKWEKQESSQGRGANSIMEGSVDRAEMDGSMDSEQDMIASMQQSSPESIHPSQDWTMGTQDSVQQSPKTAGRVVMADVTWSATSNGKKGQMLLNPYWTKKETSCDVEFDTTTEQLLNIKSVMTSLPDDPTEREQVHWRAVPSLREIWKQERQRMSKLLKPKDDFLSHCSPDSYTTKADDRTADASEQENPPPFTLNVKKDASVPGTRLAVAGMKRLFHLSRGLEDDYHRAMKDIIRRHSKAVAHVDTRLRARLWRGGGVPAAQSNHQTPTSSDVPSSQEIGESTPSLDEAIEALGALASQFGEGDSEILTSPNSGLGNSLSPSSDSSHRLLTQSSDNTKHATNRLRDYQRLSREDQSMSMGDIGELSQRVDRGDNIIDVIAQGSPRSHVEDLIDPQTLTPYEDADDDGFLDEEERMGEKHLERTLSVLATQSLMMDCDHATEQGRRDGYNQEISEEPSPRADRLNLGRLEESTNVYCADDSYDAEDDDNDMDCEMNPVENSYACSYDGTQEKNLVDHCSVTRPIGEGNRKSQFQDSAGGTSLGSQDRVERKKPWRSLSTADDMVMIARNAAAPTREEVAGETTAGRNSDQRLHPLSRDCAATPCWLEHAAAYQQLRGRLLGENEKPQNRLPSMKNGDYYLEPVKKPPSRRKVILWSSKERKREEMRSNHLTALKRRVENSVTLQIDDNSRKLTAVPASSAKKKAKRVNFLREQPASSSDVQEVEEVDWDDGQNEASQSQSQPLPLSLSVQSQEDEQLLHEKDSNAGDAGSEDANDSKSNAMIQDEHEGFQEDDTEESSRPQSTEASCGRTMTLHSSAGHETNVAPDRQRETKPEKSLQRASHSSSLARGFDTPDTESQGAVDTESQSTSCHPLDGIGQQGGRLFVQGGGGLKATTGGAPVLKADPILASSDSRLPSSRTLPSPLTIMSMEIHVQCRTGRAGVNDSKQIAMRPNSDKDTVFAVVYVYGRDPGGGESLQILERGCLFVPLETNENEPRSSQANRMAACLPRRAMGISSAVVVESVRDEKHLLLRLASIVQWKDPDMLVSWDTQGAGLGYLIERGAVIGKQPSGDGPSGSDVDLVRLLGRTPRTRKTTDADTKCNDEATKAVDETQDQRWVGSGLGSEWDDRVGAGAAAASIVGRLVFCGWKIIAEEVKHPNASYLPAIVSTVLNKRIPYHDDLKLTRWYGAEKGKERWRVLHHRLSQGVACLLLFDALDVIGRAGEAARLSGVEFSQSFPGIRGSQYKVEGVLLRALQSIQSDERGSKRGRQNTKLSEDPASSLSDETDSQTQSPWKMRRRWEIAIQSRAAGCESQPLHDVTDRSYFFFSPSLQDSKEQEALECQALTLEPQSGCLHEPVVVCDFTALYPSLVIAYNLCYSTIGGKLDYHSTRREMGQTGRTTGRLGPFLYSESRTATVLAHHFKSLNDDDEKIDPRAGIPHRSSKDRAYVAPTGAMYVSENVLKGVLPQVLDEILSTRAMLKKAAKEYKRHVPDLAPAILRQLEARQLALKYVANVTYGYTSATFSGRCAMPVLADTIVECGRRTLSNAINLANQWGGDRKGKWFGAQVIYGDTDSVFVKLPGRSVKEAFQFGEAFCKAVTASNPPPVQLKLEKVYGASIMQTKKKYCGMKYESADQKKPVFEAKGLETVRRDQCSLTQKVLRNALVTLFRSGIDSVRAYLVRQWILILAGRLPVSDFILTGRVRRRYRGGRMGPVQAVLARRLAEADPGRVVRHKERLAYVIVATPGVTFRLRDCVLTPTELLEQWDAYTIHSTYYITKHVNASLQRCLGLAPYKVDVNAWYEACPKPRRRSHFWPVTRSGSSVMISSYFGSDICSLCGQKCKAQGSARAVVCASCKDDRVKASFTAITRLNKAQQEAHDLAKICSSCNGCYESSGTFASLQSKADNGNGGVAHGSALSMVTPIANCSCIDCPNTFERHRLRESELEALALCKALGLT